MGPKISKSQNHKIKSKSDSYTSANYWAPLAYEDDEEELNANEQEMKDMIENLISNSPCYMTMTTKQKVYNWLQQRCQLRGNSGMVLDSGVTLHFVWQEENL